MYFTSCCVEVAEVASHALSTVCRLKALGGDTPRRCVVDKYTEYVLLVRRQAELEYGKEYRDSTI